MQININILQFLVLWAVVILGSIKLILWGARKTIKRECEKLLLSEDLETRANKLYEKADDLKAPMFLLLFDEKQGKMFLSRSGSEMELMKHLANKTDENESAYEFMQIMALYFSENQKPKKQL